MFSNEISVNILDVLAFKHKNGKHYTKKRSFSALSFRIKANDSYTYKNRKIFAQSQNICFVPENIEYESFTDGNEMIVIHFNMLNNFTDDIRVFLPQDPCSYQELFQKALELWTKKEPGYKYRVTSIFYEILALATKDYHSNENMKDKYIIEAAEYMKHNFNDPNLCMTELSARSCVSDALFRRKFKRCFGISPKQYLDTLRIQYAQLLISTSYFSQKEISVRCGFSDVKYFRTAFKKKTGKCLSTFSYDFRHG